MGEYGAGGTKGGSCGTVNGQLAGGVLDMISGVAVDSTFLGSLVGVASLACAAAFPAQPVKNDAIIRIEGKRYGLCIDASFRIHI